MRSLISILLRVIAVVLAAVFVQAQDVQTPMSNCLQKLRQEVPGHSRVKVITTDGDTLAGRIWSVDSSTFTLLVRSLSKYNASVDPVPLSKTQQVTIEKAAPGRGYIGLLGMGIGALAGAAAGHSVGGKVFYGSQTSYALVGTVVGAFVGGAVGSLAGMAISGSMTVKVNLKCW